MAYREFIDAKGLLWKAWDVTPDQRIFLKRRTPARGMAERTPAEAMTASEVTPSRERGWLSFQSLEENRRLSPIPPGWEEASDEQLASYLQQALPVKNRYRA